MFVCACSYVYAYVCMHTRVCMLVCVCVHTRVCVCMPSLMSDAFLFVTFARVQDWKEPLDITICI